MVQKFHAVSEKIITDRIFIYVIHSTTTITILLLLYYCCYYYYTTAAATTTIILLLLLLLLYCCYYYYYYRPPSPPPAPPPQAGAFTKSYHIVMGIRIWEKNMFAVAKGNSRRNTHTLQHSDSGEVIQEMKTLKHETLPTLFLKKYLM
jgi:hypothetical protein